MFKMKSSKLSQYSDSKFGRLFIYEPQQHLSLYNWRQHATHPPLKLLVILISSFADATISD